MKHLLLTVATMILMTTAVNSQKPETGFYQLEAKTIDGEAFNFDSLRGKKVMIVNTASKCGFTPQYEQLQELYKTYGDNDFTIIGFPANNFLRQEPGTAEEIKEFCRLNYGVTFTMMEKISVKGDDMHPVYQWLTQKAQNGFEDSKVQWNFQKYLINENGQLEQVIPPKQKPNDPAIISWITKE
ncbi:glutathione peroxidase [Geofilum sp. OHC36d9]|uniref:glutathione peroxidase n=1 Tax=Geofilum sp. OHC36d9 TaxID=3458413 RepID=UPI004033A601